jgi:hypothetical protein
MARQKKPIRFVLIKMSLSYWLLYDGPNIAGYIARGSERNVYFCNSQHKLLGSGYTSMRIATESFKAQLLAKP